MKKVSLLVLIIAIGLFLGISFPFIINSSFYVPTYHSSTQYHQNPTLLPRYSLLGSEDIQNLQEFLDIQRSIVLNIKSKNFQNAKKDFLEYKTKSRELNDAVNTLTLNETMIGKFNRENQKNLIDLEKVISESEDFYEINHLAMLYKAEDNPAFFYSYSYKGDTILKSLISTITQYRDREAGILEISKQLNLNTSQFQEIDSILNEIISENQKDQEEWGEVSRDITRTSISQNDKRIEQELEEVKPLETKRPSISITLSPISGRYGEILQLNGISLNSSNPEVTLFLDGNEWMILQPDMNGIFSTPLKIEVIRTGKHAAFATSGNLTSNLATFTVIPIDTELRLEVNSGKRLSELFCNGELYAGEIPVTNATVKILVDNFEYNAAITNQTGYYTTSIRLPVGNHTIQTIFDDTSFPLNYSESTLQPAYIKSSGTSLFAERIGIAVVILGILGGAWYLKRISEFGIIKPKPYPPSIMSNKKDNEQQISGLSSLTAIRDNLLKYLSRKKEEKESPQVISGSEEIPPIPAESSLGLPAINDEEKESPQEISGPEEIPPIPAESSLGLPAIRDNLLKYLSWKKEEKESPVEISGLEEIPSITAESSLSLPAIRDIQFTYQNLVDSGDSSEASFLLYQYIVKRYNTPQSIINPFSLTPREFAHMVSTSFGSALQSFIARYEEVRYEGLPLEPEDKLLTYWQEVLEIFELKKG